MRRSIIRELYGLITANEIIYFDVSVQNDAVYELLLVGWDGYGYSFGSHLPPSETKVDAFRRRAMSRSNIYKSSPDYYDPDLFSVNSCNIIFIVKDMGTADHKFGFTNADELLRAVAKKTPCSIERVTWSGMPLAE